MSDTSEEEYIPEAHQKGEGRREKTHYERNVVNVLTLSRIPIITSCLTIAHLPSKVTILLLPLAPLLLLLVHIYKPNKFFVLRRMVTIWICSMSTLLIASVWISYLQTCHVQKGNSEGFA